MSKTLDWHWTVAILLFWITWYSFGLRKKTLVSAGFELKISDHVRTVPGYSEFELGRSRDDFVLTRAPNEGWLYSNVTLGLFETGMPMVMLPRLPYWNVSNRWMGTYWNIAASTQTFAKSPSILPTSSRYFQFVTRITCMNRVGTGVKFFSELVNPNLSVYYLNEKQERRPWPAIRFFSLATISCFKNLKFLKRNIRMSAEHPFNFSDASAP